MNAMYEFRKNGKLSTTAKKRLKLNAGFYGDRDDFAQYLALALDSLFQSDLNIAWKSTNHFEFYESELIPFRKTDTLKLLEPFQHDNPWLNGYKGSICVVSSFTRSMKEQLGVLDKVHPHLALEDVNWSFVKSAQTNGTQTPEQDYFTNLYDMFDKIVKIEPDLVLLSCGSYSVPLSGMLKTLEISNIVMGGSLQLLFGLRGSRWEKRDDYITYFNPFWIRPKSVEKPLGAELIEEGCYW